MALSFRVTSSAAGLLLAALGTPSGRAATSIPVGSEFQVNTYTSGSQQVPGVAVDADGDFVVVWHSAGAAGGDPFASIQGQRYDSAGSAVGSQFLINTYTTGQQRSPCVAADPAGGFVVVWQSNGSSGSDTDGFSIQGQRYDSAGSVVGSQFQVNTYTTGYQGLASVAEQAAIDFVVVWHSEGSSEGDTDGYSIHGQRYASSGSAVGSEFQINTYTTSDQLLPSVAAEVGGGFVVVWESLGSSDGDTDGYSIHGQRYASSGSAVGSQFQVNTYTTSYQWVPSVAASADGDFVVVWESLGSSGSDTFYGSIQGQRYDSGGSPIGSQFQVNTYTTHAQGLPSVTAEGDGGFVVVWQSYGSWGSDIGGYSIQGRRYDGAGSALGSQFQVNTYIAGWQVDSAVSANASGDFVVVWGRGFDAIQGQRYTTAAAVPSLSPAALAAAALLMCLAAGIAMRRRV